MESVSCNMGIKLVMGYVTGSTGNRKVATWWQDPNNFLFCRSYTLTFLTPSCNFYFSTRCSPFGFTYACFTVCSQERRAFLTKVLVQVCHPLIWIPVLSTVIFCVGFTRRCKTSRNWSSLFWLVLLITNNDSFLLIPSNIGVVGL